jgi:hypothetical protein
MIMKMVSIVISIALMTVITSCETLKLPDFGEWQDSSSLSTEKIVAGLKQALDKGTAVAVSQLSKQGGFSSNKAYRIGVPKGLDDVAATLKKIGLGSLVTSFENKMNDAAEQASASAGPVFLDAIKKMTFSDARNILNGSNTAATDYLKKTTFATLKKQYEPIVTKSINKVGVGRLYNDLMAKYDAIPFKAKPSFSLENYITDKALNALFLELAKEETKIRENPAARTTELLKQVFGQ